jgi:PPP family 3-phenylpropionic acid transporter
MKASGSDLRPLARRLSVALFGTSAIYGLNLAFFPLWLQSRGLDADQIGLILALPTAAVILANPIICAAADRMHRIAGFFIASGVAIPIGFLMVASSPNLFWLFVAAAATAVARAPLLTLADALAFALVKGDARIDYARIRIWVSAAVLIAMAAGGFVVERVAPQSIIWIIVSVTAAGGVAALLFSPRDGEIAAPPGLLAGAASGGFRGVARPSGALALVIVAASAVQASHAVLYSFGSLHWRAQGMSDVFVGLSWAVGVGAEIMLFATARMLGVENRPGLWLTLGAAGAALRWILGVADPGPAGVLALQAMHLLSFGATHLGSIYILARLAPPQARAQAQGWLASANAFATMLATALSGPLYARWGAEAYWAMAGLAALGLALALIATASLRGRGET